jgi:hypothetical protein
MAGNGSGKYGKKNKHNQRRHRNMFVDLSFIGELALIIGGLVLLIILLLGWIAKKK